MKKILVVDDSQTIREQIRQALTPAGYDVVEAYDGRDGLEKIRASQDLSLILCDVNMPNMTGLEMIEQLRLPAAPPSSAAPPPIIMLTSEGQPSLIRRAREAGAKGWIVKPFKVDLLIAAIKKVTAAAA